MPGEIYFIRHGQPDRSTGVPYQIMPGPPLSEHGKHESRQAAAFLAGCNLEHLFVSPYERAVQTAEQILTILDLPVTFTRLVAEQEYGESSEQVKSRTGEFLRHLDDSPLHGIGVVSHGSPIKHMLLALTDEHIDLSSHIDERGNPLPTAGIWRAQQQDGIWVAELVFRPAAKP